MPIQITAFPWVPAFAQGYVKDLRIRWALEEAGLPYHIVLVDPATQASAAYRDWQPFGQVPAYRDDDVALFESGAILIHLLPRSPMLAPPGEAARARITAWIIAALNSIEPHAQNLLHHQAAAATDSGAGGRQAALAAILHKRLDAVAARLADLACLEGDFSAADIMMTMVLRELVGSGALDPFPALQTYVARHTGRPAFVRSLAAQLETFRQHTPPDQAA